MSKCPGCQKNIGRVALVDLVFTWEPVKDELVETGWHKSCYLSAQQSVEPTVSKRGGSAYDSQATYNESLKKK